MSSGLSYRLGITAANAIDDVRLPQHYHEFVNDITLLIDIAADARDTRLFFRWPTRSNGTSTLPIVSLQQKRAWRFNFPNTEYVVQLATIQDAIWSKQTGRSTTYEMRWGVSMWHARWDMWLSENANLRVGEKASWRPEEGFLFPVDRNPHQFPSTGSAKRYQKMSKEELEDQEAEAMFFHAGTGFKTLMRKLRCVEDVILGTVNNQEGYIKDCGKDDPQNSDRSTDDDSFSEGCSTSSE